MASADFSFMDLASSRSGASNPNPMFDFLTGFAPRKLKDLFRWVEYLYYNSAHIFAALKKFAEYPVTDITIKSNDEALTKNWERVLHKSLRAKKVAICTGLDLHLYGNSFISIYHPFNRFLICNSCKARTNVQKIKYKFRLKAMSFSYHCPSCHQATTGTLKDEKVADEGRINVIRWDPKLMDINFNPITGESKYYYTIPQDLKRKVEKGDEHIINTMPVEFLRAIKDDKVFEFADGQIYHMKIDPPAGIESHWGFPPLTATIKLFFYTAVLRKANEAIALEHIVPFRVLHPAPISGAADPANTINLLKWRQELETNLRKWRRDPNHIMFAPAALGVTMMGGQGRALLTLGEVKEAEDNIIAAMGIPREFLYGGLSFTGSAITLRMLENQLETYSAQLDEQLEWIIEQVAKILGWKPAEAEYTPFRLIDDAQQKQLLLNMNSMKPLISDGTILDLVGIDINEERKKRQQEMLDETRHQMDTQKKMQNLQNSIVQQAQQEAMAGGGAGLSYNPQQVLAQAEQIVAQMQQLDEGTQRSVMSQLSQEDPVMYAVVKDRWQTAQSMTNRQAAAGAKGG
jgi:phenylpropionate dioxygenase-like ring-hydroxylating dioxygenase large terminal subunit